MELMGDKEFFIFPIEDAFYQVLDQYYVFQIYQIVNCQDIYVSIHLFIIYKYRQPNFENNQSLSFQSIICTTKTKAKTFQSPTELDCAKESIFYSVYFR